MAGVTILTKRLIISEINISSYENVTKLYADSENNCYATGLFGKSAENEVEIKRKLEMRMKEGINLTAEIKESKSFAGYLSVGMSDSKRKAWVYTLIIAPEHRKKGYGAEFVSAVENYLKEELDVEFLGLSVFDENIPAKKFWESQGFQLNKMLIKSGIDGLKLSKINIYIKFI